MKPNIPIIGANNPTNQLLTLDLWRHESDEMLKSCQKWDEWSRVQELRKSCGVETTQSMTINIRKPPRYFDTFRREMVEGDL